MKLFYLRFHRIDHQGRYGSPQFAHSFGRDGADAFRRFNQYQLGYTRGPYYYTLNRKDWWEYEPRNLPEPIRIGPDGKVLPRAQQLTPVP